MPTETAKKHPQGAFLRSRDDDRRIAALADRQHGVVERGQLNAMGLGRRAVAARLRSGRLHQLHAGIYLVGHRLVTREGRWLAAVLASGPEAVLSHWSAAHLWMIRPNSKSKIDVTTPHKSRSWKGIRRHHSPVPPDEITIEEGIPVTSVPRTILDLAATVDADTVENFLREAEHRRLADRLSLPDLIARYPGKRGTRKVLAALDRLREEPVGRKRSKLEERFAPFLRQRHLPLPRFNDWIVLGPKRYLVDCHWPQLRQILELDGWETHSTRSAFQDDRARDRRLTAAGYTVTHITWKQLDEEPDEIAADLRALLLHA